MIRVAALCFQFIRSRTNAVTPGRRGLRRVLPAPKSPAASQAGYSLIEILVAMAIMSLAVSIVVPNAFDLVVRFQRLTERSAALDAIAKCRMEAVISNQVISLSGRISASGEPSEETRCLVLPADWTAEFEDPLIFSPAGICRGSNVQLVAPNGDAHSYKLERTTCDLLPINE